MNPQYQEPKEPAHTVRVGAVQAAIWASDTKFGILYNVTLEQRYKDDKDNWCSTSSINASQLPQAEKALAKAFDWVHATDSQAREA